MDLLRVVTLNLWNDRHRPERRIEVAAEGLRALEPDLIGLQEVREAPEQGRGQASALAKRLGMHFAFGVVDAESPGGAIGNAILSRFPIVHAENFPLPSSPEDPRAAVQAVVRTPAGEVCFTSCHLSWEPHAAPRREQQVLRLAEICDGPSELTTVVVGDFNTSPDSKAIRFFCGLDSLEGRGTFFRDAYARHRPHDDGLTWSSRNPFAVRWIEQNRRIDYVFIRGPVTPGGARTVEDARVVLDGPAADGTWPSDHFGVLAVLRLTERIAVHAE